MLKKKSSEVEAGRATLISSLSGLLGSPPILPVLGIRILILRIRMFWIRIFPFSRVEGTEIMLAK
jgi:hypothetical protein